MTSASASGGNLTLRVYSRRGKHDITLKFVRNDKGWYISHNMKGGACDSEGQPYLYGILDDDEVAYTGDLKKLLAWLWIRAESQALTTEQIQEKLNELSDWIRSTPGVLKGEFWHGA